MADELEWFLSEDGCIDVNERVSSLIFHPTLNVLLAITRESTVKVLDVCAGILLQNCALSACYKSQVSCTYIPGHDKVLFTDGKSVGLRRDHNGVLLLDTILQTRVSSPNDVVRIELLLSEAVQLLRCLQELDVLGSDQTDEVRTELESKIAKSEVLANGNHKVVKWCTVCLELPHNILKAVFSSLVQELKRLNRSVPSLSIASAVSERLNSLLPSAGPPDLGPGGVATVDRSLMFSEMARRETFGKWPHMNYKWALPDQMAQAGFYHQSNSTGDDRAMCFTCSICLVCWEPTDEPWSEHERHSPSCPFVKGEYTQNVPLSVTNATSPAILHSDRLEKFGSISVSTYPDLVATSTENGSIVVWNVARSLKKEFQFKINLRDPFIVSAISASRLRQTKQQSPSGKQPKLDKCDSESDETTQSASTRSPDDSNKFDASINRRVKESDLSVTALAILGPPDSAKAAASPKGDAGCQPLLVVGASIGTPSSPLPPTTYEAEENPLVQAMNDVNQTGRSLDIMKMEQEARRASEEASGPSQRNNGSPAPSGLYLLHCVLGWQQPRCGNNHGAAVGPASKSSKSACRDAGRLLCQSLGMLLSDDPLDGPYGLGSFVPAPALDSKFETNSYAADHAGLDEDDAASADGYEAGEGSQNVAAEGKPGGQPCGHVAGCLELPGGFDGDLFAVTHVVPAPDGRHVLVAVGPGREDEAPPAGGQLGALFLYRLERREEGAALAETPALQRTLTSPEDVVRRVVVLPEEVREVRDEAARTNAGAEALGFVAVVTAGGLVQVLDLSTLDRVGEMRPPVGTAFVAAAYCASIERICASTSDGNLHFLQLWPKVRGSSAPDASGSDPGPSTHSHRDSFSGASGSKDEKAEDREYCQLLANQPLTFDLLTRLHGLTHFVNLTPRFAATLPACWSEIQQEQKQRRHPQHLQQQGESDQHTRSWRLQPDSNTSEEHLFEITLPRACCVGHIDFKFNLQPVFSSTLNIQVTLLKQNTGGLGKKDVKAKDSEVDSFVSLNIKAEDRAGPSSSSDGPNNNRVLNPDFLKTHNAEVVCGPLPLSSYIDLSGQCGIVTFTSPALLQTKARTFLIHLKHVGGEKEPGNGKREVPSTSRPVPASQTSKPPFRWQNLMKLQDKHGPVPSLQSLLEYYVPPGSAIELLAASAPNRKTENPKGCDLFHEISITVRATRATHLANERLERLAMLGNEAFYERLIAAACCKDVPSNDATTLEHQQHLALDILNWIAAIQSGGKTDESEGASVFPTVQANLDALIKCCFLDTSRSVAHKCSKLFVFCMEFPKRFKDQGFDAALLRAILHWLPSVVMCRTAGALHWFFLLLNRIKFLDGESVGRECLSLLVGVVRELDGRTDPLHALLRARFGLYRTPFELELFEAEAPLPLKPTSTPVTYAAVVGNGGGGAGATAAGGSGASNNNNGMYVNPGVVMGSGVNGVCPHSALSQAGTAAVLSEDCHGAFGAFNPPTQQLRGLLEVEPLHFTCHAASDGTKVERVDPGLLSGANNSLAVSPNMTVYVPSTSGIRQSYSSSFTKNLLDPKKIQDDLLKLLQIKQNLTPSFMTNQNQSTAPKGGAKPGSSSTASSAAAAGVAVTPVPVSPWQHFLHPPPQQALVIERMHSGARRFVVLDFGKPIHLTDLMIPSCPDLVSLSIDIWTEGEEVDGQRLIVSTDIWFLSLVMNDLLPPPRCRFLKITAIGRYGMSTTRCRIPMGTFYGHTTPLPWLQQGGSEPAHAEENPGEQLQMHLNVLSLLLEDIHCRYSLACDKLHSLLGPLLASDRPASGHVQTFIQREQGKASEEEQQVFSTYRDCVQLQQQFNLAAATVERLKRGSPPGRHGADVGSASTDKLRVLAECLLVTLLGMTYKPHVASPSSAAVRVSQPMCELLFRYLAVGGSSKFQTMANGMLVRTCGLQPWWGSFVAKMLVELYHSQQTAVFPQDRVFLLLVSCHDKALLHNTLPSILELLQNLLAPITESDCFMQGSIDLSLVGWVLLFISFYVDIAESKNNDNSGNEDGEGAAASKQQTLREKDSGPSCRWDFIQEEWSMLRNQSNQNKMASHRLHRRKLQKRLMYHKQQLENLEQVKKTYGIPPATTFSVFKNGSKVDLDSAAKQHEQLVKKMIKQHTAKHFKDMVQIRRSESASLSRPSLGEPSTSQDRTPREAKDQSPADVRQPPFRLPRGQNLKVAHGLAALLLSMDYTCNVDMFLLTCKVLAKIATFARPAIGLGEIVNQAQLDQLLLRCVGRQGSARSPFWGGPWAGHAITCLLQDIVEGEKLYPIIRGGGQERPPLSDVGLAEPQVAANPIASTSANLEDLSPPGGSGTAKTSTDADKMTPMQMQTDSTLAGLIKLLDVDSDDTSSDEIYMDCNDSYNNMKFSSFPLKKSWAMQSKALYFKNSTSTLPRLSLPDTSSSLLPVPTVSAAVDSRLELGVDVGAELCLRAMAFSENDVFVNAFFLPIAPPDGGQSNVCSSGSSPEDFLAETLSPLHFSAPATSSSVDMLAICFDSLFQKAGMPGSVNLESLLHLWITLNEAASDQVGSILPLSLNAAAGILAALSWHPTLSLRTWYLAFRALQLPQGIHGTGASFSDGSSEFGAKIVAMARAIAADHNLLPALIKFLSGSGLENAHGSKFTAGPSVSLELCNFVTRLLQVCNNLPSNCKTGLHLKEQLLRVVYILVANNGPIRIRQGPLDSQCRLVNLLLTVRFDGVDTHLQTSVVEAVSSLVHTLIHSGQRVSCRSSTESDVSDASCFGGILRGMHRNPASATVEVTQSTLVHALLSLCIRLVQSPCGETVLPPPQQPQPPPRTENASTPLTDTLKMEQRTSGTAIGQPGGEVSRHARPSVPQTDEHKSAGSGQAVSCTHGHSISPWPKQQYIADEVLHHQPTMMWLLHSLSACSGSTMAMLLGPMGMSATTPCPVDSSDKFFLGEPVSVGDLIFQLLCTLNSKASSIASILQPILAFLSSGTSEVGPPDRISSFSPSFMSEPLLWLIMRILDCEPTISEFLCMGGIQLICKNLVSCHRHQVNTHPSLLSVIMQKVNRLMAPSSGKGTWSNLESVDGLVNFAPLGSISLKDPSIQPADILIQPTPPHRRARTPAWSYHFYPEESWVDLTITLPCAILLREVHIQPHLTSLATCPSSVALEISSDGSLPPRPLCPPLSTSGLTFIRQQFSPAEIATTVVVRLYKPRDSSNIGLSQILLLGTSAFGDSASGARASAVPTEESVAKSSVGWLRLLHHFLVQPCGGETLDGICAVAAAVPGVLQTCCSLLLTPTPEMYASHIELVLLQIGRHSIQVGLEIINILLKMCSSPFGQGNWSQLISRTPTYWPTMDSVLDIVFLLCTTRDSSMTNRIGALLDWLLATARSALEQRQHADDRGAVLGIQEPHGIPTQAFIHCFAAILWFLHESGFRSELSLMFNVNTFRLLYDWSSCLSSNSNTRRAVNSVFTSICYVRPDYFSLLMEWMGFARGNPQAGFDFDESEGLEAPITDDSKFIGAAHQESGSSPPDSLDLSNACLNSDTLSTLAAASQSPEALMKLIDSGLPRRLARAILDFCLHEGSDWTGNSSTSFSYSDSRHGEHMTDADKAGCSQDKHGPEIISGELLSVIIQFFTDVCGEGSMRDWLGGPEFSCFWLPLLDLLCLPLSHAPCSSPATGAPCGRLTPQQRATLESVTIQFLSRCCWCHLDNQQLLAQVLCAVISKQSSLQRGGYGVLHSISGFARRLILQLLLENEKILVFVKSCTGICSSSQSTCGSLTKHPRFGCGHRFRLIYANTQMTCADILRSVTGDSNAFPLAGASVAENRESMENPLKDLGSIGLELVDYLSVAAGVQAKDKRQKIASKGSVPLKSSQGGQSKSCPSLGLGSLALSSMELVHEMLPDQPLPGPLTMAQLLTVLEDRGDPLDSFLVLTLQQSKKIRNETFDVEGKSSKDALLSSDGYPSALQVFASVGGLALLAPYLPVLYPDMGKSTTPQASKPGNGDKTVNDLGSAMDADWVKVEAPDEMFDDFPELLAPGTSTPHAGRGGQLPPSVPPHSLAAFGLFLRLPSYAETLLKEREKAQCLLRLALGVTDNGEGGDIFASPIAASLPTLPFEVLRQLFDSMPLTTDDGVLLRRMALDVGAVHLLLACLSILSHQKVEVPLPGLNQELIFSSARLGTQAQDIQSKSDDKSHLYWAKGTGFGTGSTAQSWDVEQAISKQKSEEEHVTCLLQVLASYINPRGAVPFHFLANNEEEEIWLDVDSDDEGWGTGDDESANETPQPLLPAVFPELLAQSCVFNTVSSYLRNDSVLDMARHVPLYRALLQLLRAMAVSSQLVGLLLPSIGRRSESGNDGSGLSICCLLTKMKACVDTYASRLRLNKSKEGGGKAVNKSIPKTKEEEESGGLALLIPDVQETARIVETATARLLVENEELMEENMRVEAMAKGMPSIERPLHKTLEERYLEVMKRLQFDTFEMIVEDEEGFRFTVPHHFESNMRAVGDHSHPSRARRLAQEAVTLSTSLPLSYSSSVYVRCDQDRLDLMKVLITGPADTPYANGCFEFDVYFPPDYPNSPMLINLETTGHHTVRFNPNLYNDGKVCLSILNTWHGRPEEKWNPHTSSFLQVLVSIQSLILVPEPYFNEPGYERSRGTPSGQQSSREYDSNIRQATVKWAMLEQMKSNCSCFKEVIQRHFWMKRSDIVDQCQTWIAEMEAQGSDRRAGRTVALNCQALKRHFTQLKEEFSRMKPPADLEDLAEALDWQPHPGSGSSSSQSGEGSGSARDPQAAEEDGAAVMDGFLQLADSLPDLLPPDEDSGSSSHAHSLFCGPI